MKHERNLFRRTLLMAAACSLSMPFAAAAQEFKDLKPTRSPLVLKSQGSFYVGGRIVTQSLVELGYGNDAGRIAVDQMYVQYKVPMGSAKKAPVVMIHGMTLTGKTWETTPDGRMGWDEYFVRNGRSTYLVDQVARGRSGFDQARFNNARAGLTPPAQQPNILRISLDFAWTMFRFGTRDGAPYANSNFPLAYMNELAKQGIPDVAQALPDPNPNYTALADLGANLKGAVLMSHSASGAYPIRTALLNSAAVKGMIIIEPGGCGSNYTAADLATLAKSPILVIFGDHLEAYTGLSFSWKASYDGCNAFIKAVNDAGGKAQMLYLPDVGMHGGSHMLMQDKDSFKLADLILKWLDKYVDKNPAFANKK